MHHSRYADGISSLWCPKACGNRACVIFHQLLVLFFCCISSRMASDRWWHLTTGGITSPARYPPAGRVWSVASHGWWYLLAAVVLVPAAPGRGLFLIVSTMSSPVASDGCLHCDAEDISSVWGLQCRRHLIVGAIKLRVASLRQWRQMGACIVLPRASHRRVVCSADGIAVLVAADCRCHQIGGSIS